MQRVLETLDVSSLEETAEFSARFTKHLKGGVSVALVGPLGAGKTTFVRLLAGQLGCKAPILSPSFVVQYEYKLPSGLRLEHWDLYRLDRPEIELAEAPDEAAIRVIEWADKHPEVLNSVDYVISFEITDQDSRSIIVSDRVA